MQIAALFRLDGRTAIVTGGASRFGSPISRALAQAGANVMIASRRLQPCEELALELREEGLSAHALQVDLADDDSIRQLAQACAEKFGGIDILVNNAVSREFADELEELDRTSVMASMEVNIAGQISMVQAVLPYMKRRGGGSILFLSSVNALTAPKFSLMTEHRKSPANYTMEKWGINGLTKWLAARYGKDYIRVNSLCPGTFDPDMFKQSENAAYIRNVMEYRPISRFMCAEEVAGPALFLVSDAASYCTGVLLAVDGGYSL